MIKEAFFFLSFEQAIFYIEQNPLDLEAHTLLCEVYFLWSLLYLPPKDSLPWIPVEYSSAWMEEKFLACSSRAIEECKILKEYGTSNRWLLLQLAKIYELQGDTQNQTLQYEELNELFPADPVILSQLGSLYFIQGDQAKGLKIYQTLKEEHPARALEVLSNYASAAVAPSFS